ALLVTWAAAAHAARPDAEGSRPFWQPFREQVLDAGRFGNVLIDHSDELFALIVVALWFAAAVLRGERSRPERWWRLPLVASLLFVAYLASPVGLGYVWYIHTRALPFLALLLLSSAVLARRRLTAVLLGAAAALQVAYSARLVFAYRAFDAE